MYGKGDEVELLIRWAFDIRTFCAENDLRIKPTSGGIAAQLLRHPRFYPDHRRKVPASTNKKAREHLPGNYYELRHDVNKPTNATYLDQETSHHNNALSLTFPHGDFLFAKGFFHSLPDRSWAKRGSVIYKRVMAEHGLLYVNLFVPHPSKKEWRPPYMKRGGFHRCYIFTNELPMIHEIGGYVEYIIAAWTSNTRDSGPNAYARWAKEQLSTALQESTVRVRWLKPTLLSLYGILAARPRPLEFGYKRAVNGEPKNYALGGSMIQVQAKRTRQEFESPTANVIQRGMIEAETRLRSIMLARDLTARGITVLALYADSVFVESGTALPLLPYPWKVQQHVTDLRFFNSTSFTSREVTKLPGIPRADLDRLRRVKAFGAVVADATKRRKLAEFTAPDRQT